jgi:hypothetical protein
MVDSSSYLTNLKKLPRTNTQAYFSATSVTKKVFKLILGTWTFAGLVGILRRHYANVKPGNTKGGSIIVPLTSCLTGLESAV